MNSLLLVKILDILKDNDSRCLDSNNDRIAVANDLVKKLSVSRQSSKTRIKVS